MGRALLYWPLTAFLLVATFPAAAVPVVVGSGLGLVVIGLVGGALDTRWRAHRLRRAGRRLGPAPRTVADLVAEKAAAAGTATPVAPPKDGPGSRAA